MPSMLSATPQDLLRSKVIEPGMYVGVIKSVVQKPAKTDGSTNTIFTFIIQGGKFDGVPVDALFSEKAPGFVAELMSILLGKPWDGTPVDVDNSVGKKVKIHVINEKYLSRLKNTIDGYAPMN